MKRPKNFKRAEPITSQCNYVRLSPDLIKRIKVMLVLDGGKNFRAAHDVVEFLFKIYDERIKEKSRAGAQQK